MSDSKGLQSFGRVVLIVDMSPSGWAALKEAQNATGTLNVASEDALSIAKVLELIFMFAHQYNMLNRSNRISLISLTSTCTVSYPQDSVDTMEEKSSIENAISRPFNYDKFCTAVLAALKSSTDATVHSTQLPISVALSRAFLLLNRQEHDLCVGTEVDSELELPLLMGSSNYPARIIAFSLGTDDPSQTIASMNAIFACHKKGITIDSVQLGTHHSSPLLQVAAELTSGYHAQVQSLSELLKLIVTVLLVDSPHRNLLKMPRLATVDHRATCFCHQRFISVGYVCSVCLAVFCEPCETCKVCSVEFSKDSMPSLLAQAINQLPSTF